MPKATRQLVTALTVMLLLASKVLASTAPVIGSVTAGQRADKSVEIHYDLTDAEGDPCTISVQGSDDGGTTWNVPVTALTGDVGPGITSGVNKVILWNCKVDLPGVVGSRFKIRICADDGHNQPPTIFNPVITGELNHGEQGLVELSCSAKDPDGTVQSVTADLTALAGSAAVHFSKGSGDQWYASASVTPGVLNAAGVTFTATDNRDATAWTEAPVEIMPPGMVLIPAGEFQMGDSFSVDGDLNERPVHTVYVDKFCMDRHEVTNQQYTDALNRARAQGLITVTTGVVYESGSGTRPPLCNTTTSSAYSGITWNGSTFQVVSGKQDHPVILVSWYGAAVYANWQSALYGRTPAYDRSTWNCNWGNGYRLPTEAEWERAARGGAAGQRFPWSDKATIDHSRANYYSSAYPFYDVELTPGYDPVFGVGVYPYTSPVRHFAKNGYGLYDMAGNVWEWCHDWFDGAYYANSPANNPRGPEQGDNRVLRGGAWGSLAVNQRCAYRTNGLPNYRSMMNGFRLVLPRE